MPSSRIRESRTRAWFAQAFEDVGGTDWTFGWVLYVLATLAGAMLVGDRTISVADAFSGIPLAMIAGWFWRRDRTLTACVVGAVMLGLGFAAGASGDFW